MSSASIAERPDWDDIWIAIARIMGTRSLCSAAQVGCVVVDTQQRIISTGYNNPPRGFVHRDHHCRGEWCPRSSLIPTDRSPVYDDCPSLHAEANAISVGDYLNRAGGTIYVTSHTCMPCAKLIANSGLSTLVVAADGAASHRSPDEVYAFLESCGVDVVLK